MGLVHSVATHELGHEERAERLVAGLGYEAQLCGRSLGRVRHLLLGVVRGLLEELTLGQHTCRYLGGRVTQLADVRLLGEAVDAEIDVGVGARLAMDGVNRILKFYSFCHCSNKVLNRFGLSGGLVPLGVVSRNTLFTIAWGR